MSVTQISFKKIIEYIYIPIFFCIMELWPCRKTYKLIVLLKKVFFLILSFVTLVNFSLLHDTVSLKEAFGQKDVPHHEKTA